MSDLHQDEIRPCRFDGEIDFFQVVKSNHFDDTMMRRLRSGLDGGMECKPEDLEFIGKPISAKVALAIGGFRIEGFVNSVQQFEASANKVIKQWRVALREVGDE